jgi:DNA-binding LytR/AlgR family response regulator
MDLMKDTLTAIIADDEEHLRAHLRDLLAEVWPDLKIVAEAANGLEAAKCIAQHAPSVAFLDIKMPGLTGLEVAQGIETHTRIVFITAYDQYAVDAFEREAVDYLLKPASANRLSRTVAKLQRALNESSEPSSAELMRVLTQLTRHQSSPQLSRQTPELQPLRWIRASQGEVTHQIPVDEVRYFQSEDKYTVVYTAQGEYLIRTPLHELLERLSPEVFSQVHRGTVVNMHYVTTTQRDLAGKMLLRLSGIERAISVARPYQHLFKQM